ncbi:TonB-dependent receptor domain-containing protein [Sphingosinicella sp.]|uniref:TonB-dependent receptor domain-containing protein n=1 Tax=Sphingosinicella sp. TaxID=1917971 RepID=UPI004037C8AD
MVMAWRRFGAVVAATLAGWECPADAQRAGENAVTAAEDAFGTSIGRETIGLYSSGSVRGFSANAAGNARIEGLYFDPVWQPNARMRRSLTIRVGLSAQGYPFPAPTGIVDYALRRPGNAPSGSFYASADTYGSLAMELDGVLPITDTLSVAGGGGLYRNSFYNDTEGKQHIEGVTALWRPTPAIEIQPFWGRSDIYDDEFGPNFVPGGSFLPPRVRRRLFLGPQQPKYRSTAVIYGSLASFEIDENWRLRAGLFRTFFDDRLTGANLLLNLQPDGRARQLFIVNAPSRLASTSGELRLTRRFTDGPRLHQVHLSLRGRGRRNRFDGAAVIDLGATTIDRPVPPLGPNFIFSQQSVDEVRQWTGGIAYEGRWRNVGELGVSLQRTDYSKTVSRPGLPPVETESSPWLYSVAAAAYLTDRLALYAGYTRGLEESGVAPASAVNRNEPLPAILTSQRDAGFRWTIRPNLRLVAGLFDVRKPYFERDAGNRFTLLGEVRHQGIEASLTGQLTPRLNIVAGAVLLRPRVTGEGVDLGRVGRRPVGQPTRLLRFNADWRPPQLPGVSLDLGVVHTSRRPATRDNLVSLPARTLVDIGGRYAFRLAGNNASLRLAVTNLFNVYGFDLRGSGAYDIIPGRVALASLAVDF